MQAHRPGELPLIFRDHLNAGNVAGLMTDYYAPEATDVRSLTPDSDDQRSSRGGRATGPLRVACPVCGDPAKAPLATGEAE